VQEQEARQALRNWIMQRGNASASELKDDSALASDGFINSFDIIELISYLEELSGKPVNTQTLTGEEFRSIDTLIQFFFKDAA
jgi:acyl carrier protein